ncbi:MAG: glycosyltransferase family 2 protein, partial [Pseudobdellovibrionaceae bacterium]
MANANLDSKPFLSIMVSTRNRPKELLHCLQSVQNQTFKNYEVIVLDDGGDSSQQTEAILKQIFPKGIFLCNQTCQGISSSRNSMMGAASGDWYFTIDDDAFFPSKLGLQMVVDRLNTLPNDYRILAVKILDFFKPDQRRFLVPFPKYKLAREPQLLKWAGPVSYYLGGAQAIHRSLIEDIGGYYSTFVYGQEELDLSYRTLEA